MRGLACSKDLIGPEIPSVSLVGVPNQVCIFTFSALKLSEFVRRYGEQPVLALGILLLFRDCGLDLFQNLIPRPAMRTLRAPVTCYCYEYQQGQTNRDDYQ